MTDGKKTFMELLAQKIGAIFLFTGALIIAAPVNTAFGAFSGYVVGLVFGDTILRTLAIFGLHGVTMWQLGTTLGFVSAYLRTTTTVTK